MIDFFTQQLSKIGLEKSSWLHFIAVSLTAVSVVFFSFLANFVAKRIILASLTRFIQRRENKWAIVLLEKKVFTKLSHLAPVVVIYYLAPALTQYQATINNGVYIYIAIVSIITMDALLNAILSIFESFEAAKEIPMKAFIQVIKLIIYFAGFIIIISIIMNKTPLYFLSSLGALTAILLLVFKDTILGLATGVQLVTNRMLSRGDWIEMSKYGADGNVIDIALTTVKIQNWDNTITTIPTYAFISESFKNWRGMSESGVRRIKQSIALDISTVRFCTQEMLDRLSKIKIIAEYIQQQIKQMNEANNSHKNEQNLLNTSRITNVEVFRAYADAYLRQHPKINQKMTFLVRQLPSNAHGLPIEIYVFCSDIVWANYEKIQADILDHLIAAVPEFDLRVFQNITGSV